MLQKPLCLTIPVFLVAVSVGFAQSDVRIQRKDNHTVNVTVGDEPFATYNYGHDETKPYLYPIVGPGKLRMTRDFPMKKTKGNANDHPHHRSMWIGHEVNGVDFWTCREGPKIVVQDGTVGDDHILMNSDWIDADKKIVCSDTTTWKFGSDEKKRWIDCNFTLIASEGPITINDTKEGTVAIRTHPDLRLSPDPTRGVDKVFGSALNSQGTTGKKIWGQPASWVLYTGKIDDIPASILILDEPSNFRHATTWHARDYGLVAANPFGLHDFLGMEKGSGEVNLAKGQSLTLRYRFMFFAETIDSKTAETMHSNFALEKTRGQTSLLGN
jgi:hypothetical protein